MDAASMGALVAAGGQVLSLLKSLSEASKTMDKAELGGVIIELQQAVMDMQLKQHELIDENRHLREENRELTEKIAIKENLERHYEACWIRQDDGALDGPYSQLMWDDSRKLLRMRYTQRGGFGDVKNGIQFTH